MIYHREFRLLIKRLKRASSKLNKPFCLPCKGCGSPVETSAQSAEAPTEPTGETVGATCCTRRDCEKRLGHRVQAFFGAFCLLLGGSELCKAQETRGSKFIFEFGRNSTVYCFVASENKTAPTRKIQNLSHFLKVYQRVEIYNLTFSTR